NGFFLFDIAKSPVSDFACCARAANHVWLSRWECAEGGFESRRDGSSAHPSESCGDSAGITGMNRRSNAGGEPAHSFPSLFSNSLTGTDLSTAGRQDAVVSIPILGAFFLCAISAIPPANSSSAKVHAQGTS